MKKIITFFFLILLYITGQSQLPSPKKIDSLVKTIESKKDLIVKSVSDTFPTANSKIMAIESLKFYVSKNKLVKIVFSGYYNRKDSVDNVVTAHDVYYFTNDVLIKVISKNFDESPPRDVQFYLNERDQKKYQSKATINAGKFDGANYYIETGYNLLNEFKSSNQK